MPRLRIYPSRTVYHSGVLHTTVRAIRAAFHVCVFVLYLLAFIAAFAMVFMLPIGALGLVFVSLMGLIPVVMVWTILGMLERRLARAKLARGICPACGRPARMRARGDSASAYSCTACECEFTANGEDIALPDPTPA